MTNLFFKRHTHLIRADVTVENIFIVRKVDSIDETVSQCFSRLQLEPRFMKLKNCSIETSKASYY